MAARSTSLRTWSTQLRKQSVAKCTCSPGRKYASTSSSLTRTAESNELPDDVDTASSFDVSGPTPSQIESFDPIARLNSRTKKLPPGRYNYIGPRYRRGPLHPHQPPKRSDPSSREFIPGPFSLPRLEQTYHSTLAPDLLTVMYRHYPPGEMPGPRGPKLREWDGSSPYHAGRALRQPKGTSVVPLQDYPITFRNIPRLEKIVVHAFQKQAVDKPDLIHAARMVIQSVTSAKTQVFRQTKSIQWQGLVKGKPISVGAELKGEMMYDFLAKVVEHVLPRIKDWKGAAGSSGDSNGNLTWRIPADGVATFPEIEVNYDAYPPKSIPRIAITVCTTATNDRDARMLLASMGVPFQGKHKD